jgi:hypothetical protein
MSRMSDLDLDMQEMLERGSSIEDVADFFNVPIEWAQEAFANLMQAHQEQINDSWYDEQYELND